MEHCPLSPETQRRLNLLFSHAERSEALRLLVEECGRNLPFCESQNPVGLERLRFAALKLSEGHLGKLREAIELAQLDWRDLLMAADFGDVDAHRHWLPCPRSV